MYVASYDIRGLTNKIPETFFTYLRYMLIDNAVIVQNGVLLLWFSFQGTLKNHKVPNLANEADGKTLRFFFT